MLEVRYTETSCWSSAVRGMRNPMNSWDRSDSKEVNGEYVVGDNDLDLMQRLVSAGTEHAKFMRYIIVTMDVTAPLYWWKEFDTYKVGTVANSQSTMHKLCSKEITIRDFSFDDDDELYAKYIANTIASCEELRKKYLETKDKKYWRLLIQLLPEGYNQTRTILLNYQVLQNIYRQRKTHKLKEWHTFCNWIETLPYSKLITFPKDD